MLVCPRALNGKEKAGNLSKDIALLRLSDHTYSQGIWRG